MCVLVNWVSQVFYLRLFVFAKEICTFPFLKTFSQFHLILFNFCQVVTSFAVSTQLPVLQLTSPLILCFKLLVVDLNSVELRTQGQTLQPLNLEKPGTVLWGLLLCIFAWISVCSLFMCGFQVMKTGHFSLVNSQMQVDPV